jgi:Transcriptional regulators
VALAPVNLTTTDDAFVFSPDPVGARPWHPDHFTHAYRTLADQVGIPEPLKNLRHFNATQLLAAGVDLRTTAGRLGHSDGGATTLRVYANWTRPADQRAAELLAGDLTALRTKAAAAALTDAADPRVLRGLARINRPVAEVLPMVEAVRSFRELAGGLLDAIGAGRLAPGDLLPTVSDIAVHSGLARSTVHRAIDLLGRDGTVARSGNRWIVAPLRTTDPHSTTAGTA